MVRKRKTADTRFKLGLLRANTDDSKILCNFVFVGAVRSIFQSNLWSGKSLCLTDSESFFGFLSTI